MDSRECRDFAARCLRVAAVCVDGELAERLRATAKEYLRLADESEQASAQQQQQIPEFPPAAAKASPSRLPAGWPENPHYPGNICVFTHFVRNRTYAGALNGSRPGK